MACVCGRFGVASVHTDHAYSARGDNAESRILANGNDGIHYFRQHGYTGPYCADSISSPGIKSLFKANAHTFLGDSSPSACRSDCSGHPDRAAQKNTYAPLVHFVDDRFGTVPSDDPAQWKPISIARQQSPHFHYRDEL